MNFRIKDAITCEIFQESEILTEEAGMENVIRFVTVMDVMNICDWLKSDGALLLSGHCLKDWLDKAMVMQLKEKKVAGVVTKKRCLSEFPEEMIEFAKTEHLPIIMVSENCSWMEVIQPVTEMFLSAQNALTRELLSMHNSLLDGLVHGNNLNVLCQDSDAIIHHPIAIIDNYFNPLGSSFNFDDETLNNKLFQIRIKVEKEWPQALLSKISVSLDDKYYYLRPLVSSGEHCGFLLTESDNTEKKMTEIEQIKLEQIATIAAYELLKRNKEQLSMRNYYNIFWNRFLDDKVSIEEIRTFFSSIKKNLSFKYYMAIINFTDYEEREVERQFVFQNQRFNLLIDTVKTRMPHFEQTVLFESGNHIIMLIPETVGEIETYIRELDKEFLQVFGRSIYRIGISGLHELKEGSSAYRESVWAANVIASAKEDSRTYCFYDGLGIIKLFAQHGVLNRHAFDDFLARYLIPLLRYDEQHNAQLTNTLFTLIQNGLSPSKSADALYVHKNTLLARIKRIESILGVDTENYFDLFNLTAAMMVHQVFSEIE